MLANKSGKCNGCCPPSPPALVTGERKLPAWARPGGHFLFLCRGSTGVSLQSAADLPLATAITLHDQSLDPAIAQPLQLAPHQQLGSR
jgi:hypothetical protein